MLINGLAIVVYALTCVYIIRRDKRFTVFFAFLTREGLRARLKVGVYLFAGMMIGALLLAWLMYPYPIQGGA